MRILIAEDDLTSRTMLQALLSKWGYEVVITSDGHEAWGALQDAEAPQMAILDWMMPGMDGVTLCQKLREQHRAEPFYIILLTSKDERKDIVLGLEAGADDYVAKPYDNAELHARVDAGRRLLQLQQESRERERLQGVLEMAGAVCHELNQPLQSALGYSEILLMDLSEKDPNYEALKKVKAEIDRAGELTRKIMNITTYRVKDYMAGKTKIVDIEMSSSRPDK